MWDTVAVIGVSSSLVPWLWTAAAAVVCGLSSLFAWFFTRCGYVSWMTWIAVARHVVFRPLKFPDEIPMVRRLITFYGKDKAGRECAIAQDNDLIGRLIHAANGSFGVVIELIQDAVGNALRLDDPNLLSEHFAAAYAARTGCIPENNVFVVASDWDLIDTSGLDEIEEPPPEVDSGEKPKKKTRKSKKA